MALKWSKVICLIRWLLNIFIKKFGGIKPPKEFVLVDRAAIGLGSVFMNLNSELNWHKKFETLIKGFNENKVLSAQNNVLSK